MVLRGWLYNPGQVDLANAQVIREELPGAAHRRGRAQARARFRHRHSAAVRRRRAFRAQGFTSSRSGRAESRRSGRWIRTGPTRNSSPSTNRSRYRRLFRRIIRGWPSAASPAVTPAITMHSLETGRRLPFYNEVSPLTATPEFTPDGKQVLFASSVTGWPQIYVADLDGSGIRRVTYSRSIDMEPKVNPKTGAEVAFVSGRSGMPANLSHEHGREPTYSASPPGEGEAVNPAWHPDGQHMAFSWTRGFAPGNYNVFIMDVATREYVQLTHGAGRNEHPSWAPDGRHIVFSIEPQWFAADLDHAGRWNPTSATHHPGTQYSTCVEQESIRGTLCSRSKL